MRLALGLACALALLGCNGDDVQAVEAKLRAAQAEYERSPHPDAGPPPKGRQLEFGWDHDEFAESQHSEWGGRIGTLGTSYQVTLRGFPPDVDWTIGDKHGACQMGC